ncbi:MAG: TolC family protein [Vulcanimicrobiaceae bacterium]
MKHSRTWGASIAPLAFGLALGLAPWRVAAQSASPIEAPTPVPTPVVATTPLPYPAYGRPAPDIAHQQPAANVPASISIAQAVAIAVMGSPTFAAERAQYRAIAAKYSSEKEAILPSISGSASVSRSFGGTRVTQTGSGSSTTPGGNFTTIGGQLQLQQLIFDGGRVIAAIRTAKESDIAGRDTLVRQLQTLAYTVAQNYYSVLQSNATVNADASLVRQFETQENAVRQRIRLGAAARSDLAAAQFQTAQARGALITAQGAAIGAQATFATSLGLNANALVNPQALSSGNGPKVLTYAQALKEALALRPDYLSAEHAVDSASQNVRYAKLGRFPTITASASTGYSEALPSAKPKLIPNQSLGATMSIPIFDQGLTNYNVAVAQSQLDQATAGLLGVRLTVESDVRGALANLISARAALSQAQAELQSAQVNQQATQAKYKVGDATITDIVTAEANLATAQRDDIAAIYNERLSEERYTYAMGTSDLTLP